MMNKTLQDRKNYHNRTGIVLLVTLVILVVLSILGYTLSSRIASQRHRDQYIIDYSKARYGCDSAVKYALATLEEIDPQLISRPNEPDFSDLFILSEGEYQGLLAQWNLEYQPTSIGKVDSFKDIDDTNDVNDLGLDDIKTTGFYDPCFLTIRGPYGPPWPYVTEPVEFDIGSAKVRIQIEDENAKYPLGWAVLADKQVNREAEAGFETFCELMGLDAEQIDSLKEQLSFIAEIKPFELDFKTITKTVKMPIKTPTVTGRKTKRTTRTTPRTRIHRQTITVSKQITEQTILFARLFHSSLLDTEDLARTIIDTQSRKESALKYMGTWGTQKININTAPRHVLEAAFIFGGNQVEIAEEIIQKRRIEPFTDIEDLKRKLSRYSSSINKCEKYIITDSSFFTIRITAVSGVAKASSVIAIKKDRNRLQRIAVINS